MDRERASALLAAAGLAALVAGLALLAALGTPARVLAAAGATALLVAGVLNYRQLFAFSRSRRARYGTNAILMAVFFCAILVIVQAIAVRNSARFDFTRNQRYTLAPQTLSVLDELDTDVTATAFFRRTSTERQAAVDLLDLYAHRNPHFKVDIVDPDRRPQLADEMKATYDNIVFTSGDRHRTVDKVTEEQFTNALVQVTRGTFKAVYFVTGHGEADLSSSDRTGYAAVASGLRSQGYLVQPISLLDVDDVPEDCEVLVVAGPYTPYLQDETQRIDRYLRRGGAAVFMIEPRTKLPNLEALLHDYGIALPDAEILDEMTVQDNDRDFGPRWTKVLRYQPHPITRGFHTATFYPTARPVQIIADENDVRFDTSYLAISPPTAWGEVDENSFKTGTATRDGKDLAGPLPVAAVVERSFGAGEGQKHTVARLVVIGDADFVDNANYGLLGNADFFQNTIAYLSGDEDLLAIRPREGQRDRVYITAAQGHLISALCVVLLPLSVLGVGFSVFLRRRRS